MSTYQYSALEFPNSSIRLLSIDRVHRNIVSCRLIDSRIFELTTEHTYNALSYTWGDTNLREIIYLNNKPFPVTRNLKTALWYIGRQQGPYSYEDTYDSRRYLWIDAICINQGNIEERNEQVQWMDMIYKRATHVIVWLGDYHESEDELVSFRPNIWGFDTLPKGSDSLTESAFDLARLLSHFLRRTSSVSWATDFAEVLSREKYRQSWAHLARIYKRPWFERLWVIQEIISARSATVVCGNCYIAWKEFLDSAWAIVQPNVRILSLGLNFLPLMGAERVTNIGSTRDYAGDLLLLLKRTQAAKCTDLRDKLYALLAVSKNATDVSIDYSRPFDDICVEWAWATIQRQKTLDILSACADSGSSGLPSWVPDLRKPWGNDQTLFNQTHGVSGAFQAGPSFPFFFCAPPLTHRRHNRSFELDGHFVDTISSISSEVDVSGQMSDPTKLTDALHGVITCWEEMVTIYCGPLINTADVLPSVILRGCEKMLSEQKGVSCWIDVRDIYLAWRQKLGFDGHSTVHHEHFPRLEKALFNLTHGCQMFMTASGEVGVVAGNCHVQFGDSIYWLDRGRTPFILRKLDAGPNYRLLGPCYLNGYMDPFKFGLRAPESLRTISIL